MIKLLRILFNMVFLLVMWLPFCRTPNMFLHNGLEEGWGDDYLYNGDDSTTLMTLGIVTVSSILVQILPPGKVRRDFKIIAILAAAFLFFLCGVTAAFAMQDFVPAWGFAFMATIFPILFCWFALERLQRHKWFLKFRGESLADTES